MVLFNSQFKFFDLFRLELKLRHFACLTKGDMIAVHYNNKVSHNLITLSELNYFVSVLPETIADLRVVGSRYPA